MGVRNSRYNSRYKSRRESTLAGRLIIAAAVIILVAVLVYALWHLLARRSAGELYLEAEKKSFSKLVDNIEEKYISFKDKYKPYMEGPYSSRTEISLDVPGGLGSFGLQNTDAVKGILDKSKLIINTKNDPLKGISASEADLLIERSPFLNAQLFSDSQTIWLSIPDFLPDRYFSVRRDDLGGLYERFSIPVRPLKLISGREIAANLAFGGEDFRRSAEKPAEIYSEYLTNETVADNGEKAVKIGDLVTEGREMLVTLDEEKATSLLKGLLTTIADDDALLLYTYGNFAGISELLDDAGLFRLFSYLDETGKITLSSYEKEILAKLNVRKDMDGFRESLKKTAASYRLKDGIKMKVLLDRDGDIVYRDVSLDFAGTAGGVSFRADIAAGINTAGHRILKLVLTEYGTDGANDTTGDTSDAAVDTNVAAGDINRVTELFIGSGVEETKDPAKEGNIAVICTVTDGGKKSGINISIDTSDAIDEKTMKRNSSIRAKADITGYSGEGSINAAIDRTSWSNKKLNKSNSTTEVRVDANIPFLGTRDFSAVLSMADEDVFGIEEFSLPDFDRLAVMDLYAASDAEIESLERDIMASFGMFYLENKNIIDTLLGR